MSTTDTRDRSHRARRRGSRAALALAVGVGIVGSGALVYQASFAAFTATTDNQGNSWETGSLTLQNNSMGEAMFSVTGLKGAGPAGGETGTRCITVTKEGSLPADIVLAADVTGDTATLGAALQLAVDWQTGEVPPNCAGFAPADSVYSGALASMNSSAVWNAGADTQVRTYRVTWTLPATDSSTLQGKSVEAKLTWTATAS